MLPATVSAVAGRREGSADNSEVFAGRRRRKQASSSPETDQRGRSATRGFQFQIPAIHSWRINEVVSFWRAAPPRSVRSPPLLVHQPQPDLL